MYISSTLTKYDDKGEEGLTSIEHSLAMVNGGIKNFEADYLVVLARIHALKQNWMLSRELPSPQVTLMRSSEALPSMCSGSRPPLH